MLIAQTNSHAVDSGNQRRQVLLDDKPHGSKVYAQVPMHDHVTKAGEFSPRNLRLGGLDAIGQSLTRLRERLQIANHRILNQARLLEPRPVTAGVLPDALNAFPHMREQYAVAVWSRSHNATASAITRSRSAGWRLVSVTTSTWRPSSS